ncbi:ISL3 family transposase [Desulfothermobacter acidiphilus]|uniref:ISL3 family transposase n=1 Tax=Desulfothermobacter acidiphilus TaxID=1938353 RepID=UPI003F8CDDF1
MKQFIAELLGLQGWIIYRVKIESDRIDVYAGRPREEASCPSCQTLTRRVHDRSREWRPKLHTRCNGLPVYLWVRPRRFKCPNCGKVFTERFPGIRPRARRTERAEADWLENLKDRSFRRAAEVVRTSPGTLRRLLLKQVTNQVNIEEALKDLPALALSIDEHSFRGQDMMITITCVWPERRLIAILPDDRLKTLEKFLKELPVSVRRRIKAVCIDFKDGWRKLIKRVLPGVPVVVDHFHALKDANRRVDEARLIEQQVTGQRIPRWPLVKNEEDLTERQAAQLAMIRRRYRNVAHFHWAKEQLRDVYRASCRKEAELILDRLIFNTREASDVLRWFNGGERFVAGGKRFSPITTGELPTVTPRVSILRSSSSSG